MNRSETPTNHIFIVADTGSEWDNCDFAVIELTDEWRTAMRTRLNALNRFDADDAFCSLRYWDGPLNFYKNPDEEENALPKEMLNEDEVWCFITLDEGEKETFAVPENRLSTFILVIYPYGTAMYNATGKHTGEEFWTEAFDVTLATEPVPAGKEILTPETL